MAYALLCMSTNGSPGFMAAMTACCAFSTALCRLRYKPASLPPTGIVRVMSLA
jgi:hypothetical protein